MKNFNIVFTLCLFLLLSSNITLPQSFEKAVDFDGNGDYAFTLNDPYLPTANGTLEAWIKVRSISLPGGNQGEAFIAKNEEQWNTGDFYAFFDYSNGKLKSRIQASPTYEFDVVSNNTFWYSQDTWFHYAFTWGSGGMKMYINGVLQNNQNSLTYSALNTTYNIYVGAHGYMLHNGYYVVSDYFDGQIDELRIWNFQKSNQELNALMNAPLDSVYYSTLDSGLVGYWKFDILEDLGVNNDGADDVRDFSLLHNHLDFAGDTHLVLPDPIIPVELTSFSAESNYGAIHLNWSTSTEINNLGFEIERFTENSDWITIGFIEGHGTTTEPQNYYYSDDLFAINSKIVFYRLKQVDFNGQVKFSSEIEVNVSSPNFNLEQNYPNPFNPETQISFSLPKNGEISLVVYNTLGEKVAILFEGFKEAGYHRIDFDASKLPSGVYFYTLSSNNFVNTRKMVLIK
jgi:Concanavalin A-like lectin/glucanases superfamily/Secretion system C-terminal sorting domain